MVSECLPKSIQRPVSHPYLSASAQGHSQLYLWAGTQGEPPNDKPPCQAWHHQGMLFASTAITIHVANTKATFLQWPYCSCTKGLCLPGSKGEVAEEIPSTAPTSQTAWRKPSARNGGVPFSEL